MENFIDNNIEVGTIEYGISKSYLKDWDIQNALREVIQNFIDHGAYTKRYEDGILTISNDFNPKDLSFLMFGNSYKEEGSIGGHGEGLKAALIIFTRNDIFNEIIIGDKKLLPTFTETNNLGETFKINVEKCDHSNDGFTIKIGISNEDHDEMMSRIISEDDILETTSYGRIVNKKPGNIYCGGLYVNNIENMKNAYDFNPRYLRLDRDRKNPSTFDIEWYASLINDSIGKNKISDLSSRDFAYSKTIADEEYENINVSLSSNNNIVFNDLDGNTIRNSNVVEKCRTKFKEKITNLKMKVVEKLGLLDMLIEFKNKHDLSSDAISDLDIIIKKIEDEKSC